MEKRKALFSRLGASPELAIIPPDMRKPVQTERKTTSAAAENVDHEIHQKRPAQHGTAGDAGFVGQSANAGGDGLALQSMSGISPQSSLSWYPQSGEGTAAAQVLKTCGTGNLPRTR